MELLQSDVRQLEGREQAGQLSAAQLAHVHHLLRVLQAAKEVIKANVMKTGKGVGWLEQKRWIAMQTMRRDKVRQDIAAARDEVVRSAQLLNLSLSVHVVQSMACAAAGDGGESEAEDAQQLLQYMREHEHKLDAQVEAILEQLQQGRVDQAQQAAQMAAELRKACEGHDGVKQSNDGMKQSNDSVKQSNDGLKQSNAELRLQLDRMMAALAKQPAAAVASPVHGGGSHSRLTSIPELVVGQSLRVRLDEVLGKGSGGRVLRAECMRSTGNAAWVQCAFKEMSVDTAGTGSVRAREKLLERHRKAVRKEAAVMWLLNGQPNILRLYGVCTAPLGLVFEYCNRGTLQQWLWAQVREKDARGRPVSRFVSTQQLAEASSKPEQRQRAPQPVGGRADDDDANDDDDDGGEGDGYAQLLSDGVIHGHLSLAQRLMVSQELISAVAFLHTRHLAHGDLKSSNVLVHELGTTSMGAMGASVSPSPATSAPPPQPLLCVRLSDFGSAKVQASFTEQLGSTLRGLSAAGGTLRWSAPEQLMDDADGLQTMAAGSSTDAELSPAGSAASSSLHSTSSTASPPSSPEDRSADVYSLGLLLAELFTSLPPYAHLPDAKVHHAIYTRQPPYSDALLDAVSSALTRLVQACSRPVGQRATMTQLKYQLWPDVQAELSGWQRRAAHVPAAAAPPPLPVHVAVAPPPGSWPSGGSATAETKMHAKPPPTPARPTVVLSAAPPSTAVIFHDDPFADFFAASGQQPTTAPNPATRYPPAVPSAPTATHATPAPATPSMIDGGKGALQLQYSHDGDSNGLFHHLATCGGTQPWKNPCTAGLVTVTSSPLSRLSEPCSTLVSRDYIEPCHTEDEVWSWFCFDLHSACFQLSHYTLQSSRSLEPRHWKLEGSVDGEQWDVLDMHNNNSTLQNSNKSRHTWSVATRKGRWHRHFRIMQTARNRIGTHVFYLCPMELYGALLPSAPHAAAPPTPASGNATTGSQVLLQLRYEKDGDFNGLFYHLGTRGGSQPWQSPYTAGLVSISSSSLHKASLPCSALFTSSGLDLGGGKACWTKDKANSWICIDLHSACFRPSHYMLASYLLRSWQLEASSDGEQWCVLDEHVDDSTHRPSHSSHTWPVQSSSHTAAGRWYRCFRLRQTGVNSRQQHTLKLLSIELYGALLTTATATSAITPPQTSKPPTSDAVKTPLAAHASSRYPPATPHSRLETSSPAYEQQSASSSATVLTSWFTDFDVDFGSAAPASTASTAPTPSKSLRGSP